MYQNLAPQTLKRCASCVLPESTPGISFDTEGICNYCRTYRQLTYPGESGLLRLLEEQRRPAARYDCMVGLSGGRDSTYTLVRLVKDYGMRVLAVNYQNPFTDPQATANIRNAVQVLGVDLISFKLPRQLHERTFRDNATAWGRKPTAALVPMVCIACKTMWWDILRVARRNDVRCIVSGGNRFEDVSFKKVLLDVGAQEAAESTITKAALGLVKRGIANPALLNPQHFATLAKGYLFADPYTLGSRIVGRGITKIDLFFYIPWREEEVVGRIQREVGWNYPRELNSSWRFDCKVGHLKDLMYLSTIGVTEREDLYAKMVREGVITRDDALRRIEKENVVQFAEIQQLLDGVGIDSGRWLRSLLSDTHALTVQDPN